MLDSICSSYRQILKQQCARIQLGDFLILRIKALRFNLFRITQSSKAQDWMAFLEKPLNDLNKSFFTSSILDITNSISIAEDTVISHMAASLKLPPYAFNFLLQSARQSTSQSLDIVFPKFLTLIILNQVGTNSNTITFLDLKDRIKAIFLALGMPYNYFVKSVAKKIVGNLSVQDAACPVDISRVELFFQLFFGSSKNYKFYVKIAKIYSEVICPIRPEDCNEPEKSAKQISMKPSSHRKAYSGTNQTIVLGQPLSLTTLGVTDQQSYRADGLILFGKHPDADVVFPPDEKQINYVNFIIFFQQNEYYGIDCSSNNYYSALRLEQNKYIPLKQDMLLSIAKFIIYKIDEIKHEDRNNLHGDSSVTHEYDDNDSIIDSTLKLLCLEGPYVQNFFLIRTRTRDPNLQKLDHMMGAGGGGQSPDLFVPKEYGVGRKHLTFSFKNNSWHVIDHTSMNGSYLLLKTAQEYSGSIHSKKTKLFNSNSGESEIVLLAGYYTFFLELY